MDIHRALTLNREWHSRLPQLTNWQGCMAFGAEHNNLTYAVALWGQPVARMLNGLGWIELRRMAIADDAPKNTGSRMIGWMLRHLQKNGRWVKAISYQDTDVHAGTIYRASGWHIGNRSTVSEKGWNSRLRNPMQTTADKVRWEFDFRGKSNELRTSSSSSDACDSRGRAPS
jgi:hypothetical protein